MTINAYQQQKKALIKQLQLKEARDNLSLCANKPYYSKSQLSSLRLLIENLEQELKGMQAPDARHLRELNSSANSQHEKSVPDLASEVLPKRAITPERLSGGR